MSKEKELIYVGSFDYQEIEEYYTYDYSEFYRKDGTLIDDKDLEFWAYILDRPWSQTNESYTIKCNCKDGYTAMDPDKPQLYCEYESVGMEGIIATFRAYANTPGEAATKCDILKEMIINKYMEDDEDE